MGKHGLCCHFQLFQFGLLESFGFGSAVLEPDFDLGLCEVEGAGELSPFCYGEVLLLAEFALQGQQLRRGEGSSGLAVGLVFP